MRTWVAGMDRNRGWKADFVGTTYVSFDVGSFFAKFACKSLYALSQRVLELLHFLWITSQGACLPSAIA